MFRAPAHAGPQFDRLALGWLEPDCRTARTSVHNLGINGSSHREYRRRMNHETEKDTMAKPKPIPAAELVAAVADEHGCSQAEAWHILGSI